MATIGLFVLFLGFVATIAGMVLLAASCWRAHSAGAVPETLSWAGRLCAIIAFAALTFCCGLLVFCLATGDTSIKYVVQYRSDSSDSLAWLYTLSGLWAGRQGSLLFWAWLISAFNCYLAVRYRDARQAVDDCALGISQAVMAAFLGVLLFSDGNTPFEAMSSSYFGANGALANGAELWGMNALLEHWAMAVHPPTLFIGYAGMTIPFAYALATMLLGDDSDLWVRRCNGVTAFAWLFLGIGIGLGAVWAYTVLGWGGYWGWDPVENASLLSWLAAVALMHSFTLYRQRGTFKRWSVVCACITFAFVIVGTFISRSGLVQSVHAFDGDPVSLGLFGVLIAVGFAAAVFGAVGRRATFAADAQDDEAGLLSRSMAYYLLNVLMIVGAFLLCYLTVASALPQPLPFAGQSVSGETYNAIVRPVSVFLMLVVAVCPLLGWSRTDPAAFAKKALVPGICALVLAVAIMAYWAIALLPAYDATIAAGGTAAESLQAMGPAAYYNGLAALGILVACALVFNSLFMLVKLLRKAGGDIRRRFTAIGGFLAHLSLGVMLVGLIGSSMYVTEQTGYLAASADSDAAQAFRVQGYELTYADDTIVETDDGITYTLVLDVARDGQGIGQVAPSVYVDKSTLQQRLDAQVLTAPDHDLFVVYRGVNMNGDYSLDVRVNPLILCVWVGFVLLVLGTAIAACGKRLVRGTRSEGAASDDSDADDAAGEAA